MKLFYSVFIRGMALTSAVTISMLRGEVTPQTLSPVWKPIFRVLLCAVISDSQGFGKTWKKKGQDKGKFPRIRKDVEKERTGQREIPKDSKDVEKERTGQREIPKDSERRGKSSPR